MATTTSITTTYAGEFAKKYISAALLSANTVDASIDIPIAGIRRIILFIRVPPLDYTLLSL